APRTSPRGNSALETGNARQPDMNIYSEAQGEGRQRALGRAGNQAMQPAAVLARRDHAMVQRWIDQEGERAAHQDQRDRVEHPLCLRKLLEAFLERPAELEPEEHLRTEHQDARLVECRLYLLGQGQGRVRHPLPLARASGPTTEPARQWFRTYGRS